MREFHSESNRRPEMFQIEGRTLEVAREVARNMLGEGKRVAEVRLGPEAGASRMIISTSPDDVTVLHEFTVEGMNVYLGIPRQADRREGG